MIRTPRGSASAIAVVLVGLTLVSAYPQASDAAVEGC